MTDPYQAALRARSELTQLGSAFDELKQDILKQIGDSDPHDKEKREALYFQFKALSDVEAKMVSKASGAAIEERSEQLAEAGFSR